MLSIFNCFTCFSFNKLTDWSSDADYWKKRRQPLIKPIGYIMPKLTKYCKKKSDRNKMILYLLKIMPIVDNKEAVIKTISELKNKEIV